MAVVVERRGAALWVTIDRPAKRNALSAATLAALAAAFPAAPDPDLCYAVLTGRGDRCFAAGGDLHELQALRDAQAVRAFTLQARTALDAVRRFPLPVVAFLNGDALGGGAELALACDLRLATPRARIAFLQGRLGIPTAWGGGIDLMRALGAARALDLLASSRLVGAEEAERLGLVQAVTDDPVGWLLAWAHQRPQVMRAFKAQVIAERLGRPRSAREVAELDAFVEAWLHEDHWTAAEAAISGLGRKG